MPWVAITSERLCSFHPCARSPRAALQKGGGAELSQEGGGAAHAPSEVIDSAMAAARQRAPRAEMEGSLACVCIGGLLVARHCEQ